MRLTPVAAFLPFLVKRVHMQCRKGGRNENSCGRYAASPRPKSPPVWHTPSPGVGTCNTGLEYYVAAGAAIATSISTRTLFPFVNPLSKAILRKIFKMIALNGTIGRHNIITFSNEGVGEQLIVSIESHLNISVDIRQFCGDVKYRSVFWRVCCPSSRKAPGGGVIPDLRFRNAASIRWNLPE